MNISRVLSQLGLVALVIASPVTLAAQDLPESDPFADPPAVGVSCRQQGWKMHGMVTLDLQLPDTVRGPRLITMRLTSGGEPVDLNVLAPQTPQGVFPAHAAYLTAWFREPASGRATMLTAYADSGSLNEVSDAGLKRSREMSPEEIERARRLARLLWEKGCGGSSS